MKSIKLKGILSCVLTLLLGISACVCMCGSNGAVKSVAAEIANNSSARVVGYLPNWSYQAYKNIDFSTLTHINISFCNPNSKGELQSGIPDSEMKALVEKAHSNNVKIMAALGGGGGCDGYYALIETPAKITVFNEQITSFCEKYNLDGVDLDIELDSSDKIWKPYKTWVEELRVICDEKNWLLSTATAQWVAGSVSNETFALFDYLNVMAYDNDGSSGGVKSHASYQFAVECLDYFHNRKGVPKEKLALGVPFYGRGYKTDGSLDWNSYKSFADIVAVSAANFNTDVYDGMAYNGAETIRKKCILAKDYGGIMIWEISQDAPGEYSLLSVIKSEILVSDSGQPGSDGGNSSSSGNSSDSGNSSSGSSSVGGSSSVTESGWSNGKTMAIVCASCATVCVIGVVIALVVKKKRK